MFSFIERCLYKVFLESFLSRPTPGTCALGCDLQFVGEDLSFLFSLWHISTSKCLVCIYDVYGCSRGYTMLTQNVSESRGSTCCLGENRPEVPDRGSLGSARPLPWVQTLCIHRCFPLTRLARVYPPPHRQSRHSHIPVLSLLPSQH